MMLGEVIGMPLARRGKLVPSWDRVGALAETFGTVSGGQSHPVCHIDEFCLPRFLLYDLHGDHCIDEVG